MYQSSSIFQFSWKYSFHKFLTTGNETFVDPRWSKNWNIPILSKTHKWELEKKPGIKEKSIRRFAMDQSSNILLNRINRYIWTNEKQRQNLDYFNNSYPRSTDAERRSEKPQNDKKHLLEYSNSFQNTAIH